MDFKLFFNRTLSLFQISDILAKIRRKGLKFSFAGAQNSYVPEDYILLFNKFPEVIICGPVYYGEVSRVQNSIIESHLQSILK